MPSILPGYEYDIFISYRQNDNRSGWVTDFVKALQDELAATIKEPLSVYFDTNPHDGLLETYDVDGSLKEKVKCLVFIPIVSQTYCDTKSFAWQKEFLTFLDFTKSDDHGLDIKLSNGNVAKRVLPVRIHEIDESDKNLFEEQIAGVMRPVDFIYREAGVNRPLANDDSVEKNLNQTRYKNQVNKVANAIKEIVQAVKGRSPVQTLKSFYVPAVKPKTKSVLALAGAAILILAVIGFVAFSFFGPEPELPDKSIAILPFSDISDEKNQAYFSEGMVVEIMDHLFKIPGLRIKPLNSTRGYLDSEKSLKEIAGELGVSSLLQGSVRKSGSKIKISVQLIQGSTEQHIWQQTYDRDLADIFSVQADVASQIALALRASITPEIKSRMEAIPTQSQEAYDLFLRGLKAYSQIWNRFDTREVKEGIGYLKSAILLDSSFSDAYAALGECYWMLAHWDPDYTEEYWVYSKKYLTRAVELNPNNGWAYSELAVVQHNWDWDKKGALQSLNRALELNPSDINIYMDVFWYYIKSMNCTSARDTYVEIKRIDPAFYSYIMEVMPLACAGDEEGLKKIKTPAISEGVTFWAEMTRLAFLKEYDGALKILEENGTMTTPDFSLALKGEILGLAGKTAEALQTIGELEVLSGPTYVSQTRYAVVYMAIGEEEKAYECLERGFQQHDLRLHDLSYSPSFYQKRNDPRFKAFMAKTWVN